MNRRRQGNRGRMQGNRVRAEKTEAGGRKKLTGGKEAGAGLRRQGNRGWGKVTITKYQGDIKFSAQQSIGVVIA